MQVIPQQGNHEISLQVANSFRKVIKVNFFEHLKSYFGCKISAAGSLHCNASPAGFINKVNIPSPV